MAFHLLMTTYSTTLFLWRRITLCVSDIYTFCIICGPKLTNYTTFHYTQTSPSAYIPRNGFAMSQIRQRIRQRPHRIYFLALYVIFTLPVISQSDSELVCFTTPDLKVSRYTTQSHFSSTGSLSDLSEICLTAHVETDYHSYNINGSMAATESWIQYCLDQSIEFYRCQSIELVMLSWNIPTDTSWSDTLTSVQDVLFAFPGNQQPNYATLKVFLTMRPLGGGIGFVDALCQLAYSVSANIEPTFPAYPVETWSTTVICHEIGHNIGASHPHDCLYGAGDTLALNDCVPILCPLVPVPEYSTIMSYCHLSPHGIDYDKGFGPTIYDIVVNAITASQCAYFPASLTLSGFIDGHYRARQITLNAPIQTNDLHLSGHNLDISSDFIAIPLFNFNISPCQ